MNGTMPTMMELISSFAPVILVLAIFYIFIMRRQYKRHSENIMKKEANNIDMTKNYDNKLTENIKPTSVISAKTLHDEEKHINSDKHEKSHAEPASFGKFVKEQSETHAKPKVVQNIEEKHTHHKKSNSEDVVVIKTFASNSHKQGNAENVETRNFAGNSRTSHSMETRPKTNGAFGNGRGNQSSDNRSRSNSSGNSSRHSAGRRFEKTFDNRNDSRSFENRNESRPFDNRNESKPFAHRQFGSKPFDNSNESRTFENRNTNRPFASRQFEQRSSEQSGFEDRHGSRNFDNVRNSAVRQRNDGAFGPTRQGSSFNEKSRFSTDNEKGRNNFSTGSRNFERDNRSSQFDGERTSTRHSFSVGADRMNKKTDNGFYSKDTRSSFSNNKFTERPNTFHRAENDKPFVKQFRTDERKPSFGGEPERKSYSNNSFGNKQREYNKK
jgi:hypothetical protein